MKMWAALLPIPEMNYPISVFISCHFPALKGAQDDILGPIRTGEYKIPSENPDFSLSSRVEVLAIPRASKSTEFQKLDELGTIQPLG